MAGDGAVQFASRGGTVLLAPLFVAMLLVLATLIGRRIVRRLATTTNATRAELLVISVAIGLGILQFVPFLLGAVHLLSTTSVRIAMAVLVLAALRDVPVALRFARDWWSGRRAWNRRWLWALPLAIPLVFSVLDALAPSVDPDGIGYHLTAPKRWLEIGSLDFLPTLTYTSGVMGTEMLYALNLAVVGDVGAKLLHVAAVGIAAAGVYLLGVRIADARVGYLSSALFLLGPLGIYEEIGTSYADGTATLAVVAATMCWVLWLQAGERSWLRAAALLAGIAVSFKLTAVLLPVTLAVATILIVRSRSLSRSLTMTRREGGLLAALVVAPMLPWLIRSAVVVGNPVFPVLARWIPSRDFPADLATKFESYNRYQLWGNGWGDSLDLGARKLIIAGLALAVVVVGAVLVRLRRDPMQRILIGVLAGTVVVQVLAAGLYIRYWIPLVAVIQIPLLAAVFKLAGRRVEVVAVGVVTALLIAMTTRDGLRDQPMQYVRAVVDDQRRDDFLVSRIPILPLTWMADERTAPGDAVLFTDLCFGFYVDGASLCTGLSDALRLSSFEDFDHDVAEMRITHVVAPLALTTGGQPDFGNGAGSVSVIVAEQTYAMVARLLEERGRQVATIDDWGLFELEPSR